MTTYHNRLAEVISFNKERIDVGIKVLVQEIISRVKLSKNIWLIGNGGSASTAEHFETDLTFIRQDTLTGFPLVTALTSNSALVTALSNDLSYDEVFSVLIKRKASWPFPPFEENCRPTNGFAFDDFTARINLNPKVLEAQKPLDQ